MQENKYYKSQIEIDAERAKIERIGLLLVHGIGDQNRNEHLQSVAGNLVRICSLIYGRANVSIQMFPGLGNLSDLSIIIKRDDSIFKVIDFHEVWWRDLGQKNTPFNIMRFWIWAATFSGTRGRFFPDNSVTFSPKNKTVEKGRILLFDRVLLFIKITYFFIMLFPLRLFVQLANFIPGIRRINIFGTVFNYMSSVQMYQQRQGSKGGTLVDYNQSRRISIQRRFANAAIDMAERNYNRWYIVAHSLGSVIAFKGLMCPDDAFANFISMDRWQSKNMRFRKIVTISSEYPDKPRRPVWLRENDALDTEAIFERCSGFVTWGSPLETFARTWPGMVHLRRNAIFPDNFEWINLHDNVDVISSALPSFQNDDFPIVPKDICCVSSNWIFSAHLSYFKPSRHAVGKSVGATVLRWMVDGNTSFEDSCAKTGLNQITGLQAAYRMIATLSQFLVALIVGLFVWPVSLALLLRVIFLLPEEIMRFVGIAVDQYDKNYDRESNTFHLWLISYKESTDRIIESISTLQPTLNLKDDARKFVIVMIIVILCVLFGGIIHNIRDYIKHKYENNNKNKINNEIAVAQFPDERPM